MKIDKKIIKELVDCLNEFGLTELEYGNETLKVKVSNSSASKSSVIHCLKFYAFRDSKKRYKRFT